MNLIHGTSLLSTPLPLWTYISTLGKKIDDEKTLLLKKIWLYNIENFQALICLTAVVIENGKENRGQPFLGYF